MIDQGVTSALAARDALRSTNGDDSHISGTGVRRTERAARECTYTDFLKFQPLPFKGTEGVDSLSQWCERMESVFHISNCAAENHVKFAGDGCHSSHAENPRNMHTVCPCYYGDFMKCHPLNFKGSEGAVDLTRWIEKIESVFNISGCVVENHVKFATCTLLDATLTWWNSQIRTLGPDAYTMTWNVLKKKMTGKYCPLGEVKKLKIKLWNLKVRDNNIPGYTNRFQELALICTKFVSNETEKVDKYISGLPDNIYGNVKSSKPKTLDETIELANDLMDQKLRTYAERKSDSKRKVDDISRNKEAECRESIQPGIC
nr:reverse transcriptase domain-containing protein [Tanacetum cinerariifolium]